MKKSTETGRALRRRRKFVPADIHLYKGTLPPHVRNLSRLRVDDLYATRYLIGGHRLFLNNCIKCSPCFLTKDHLTLADLYSLRSSILLRREKMREQTKVAFTFLVWNGRTMLSMSNSRETERQTEPSCVRIW